ncbi:hypothetical protein ACTMTJ_40515 [Phytohabitans sp. LJ34]|uniref:hypothetical protein n=1 Tax=Phytohabitans sp. LJ34 TaxID=3452217 RepID=UPI003F8B3C24
MPVTRLRLRALALIFALLGALLVAPGRSVSAEPAPPADPSSIGFEMDGAPHSDWFDQNFYHWSVDFLYELPGFDGSDPRLLDDRALSALGPHHQYQVGQPEHVLTAWFTSRARRSLKSELAKLNKKYANEAERAQKANDLIEGRWLAYLKAYVTVQDNRMRGKAFELAILRMLNISPTDPRIAYDKPYKKLPGQRSKRRPDLVSEVLKMIAEFKSGGISDMRQVRDLLEIAKDIDAETLHLYLNRALDDDTAQELRNLIKEIEEENTERAGRGEKPLPVVEPRVVPLTPVGVDMRLMPAGQSFTTTPVPTPAAIAAHTAAATALPSPPVATGDPGGQPAAGPANPTGPKGGPTGSLSAGGQVAANGAAERLVAASPDTAAAAQTLAEVAAEEAAAAGYADGDEAGMTPERLGGVDFSTLELRYVSDTYDGGLGAGLRYAYQVEPEPGAKVSFGGRQSAQLAADSFFTWLALPPASFTVNLNPDEPHRIMDAKLGRTEAGRTLLDADFQMKKTVAKLIHPDSATGKQFWPELHGETPCFSMRQWIVPRPAVVREQGNELFILDAPLEVKMETEYLKTKGSGSEGCPNHSTADTSHNEGVYRVVVLPELQKAVNEAPEYADLRRVYASRVAAEWYRERSAKKPTAYGHLIDSGDVSAWPLRERWTPKDTWNRFVKSYKDGEFRVERTTREGFMQVTRLYVYGGVDLSDIPQRRLSGADFTGKRPAMDAAVKAAMAGPVAEAGGGPMWLGGWSTERPRWSPIPAPKSPLGRPVFWAATAAPVLIWMIVAGLLLARRRRVAR